MKLKLALPVILVSIALLALPIVLSAEGTDTIRVGIGVVAKPGGSSQTNQNPVSGNCDGNKTSCGTWPSCYDVSKLKYCINGIIYESYCPQNVISKKPASGAPHCDGDGLIGGYNAQVNITNALGLSKRINLYFLTPGTGSLVASGTLEGEGNVSVPESIEDMKFEFDNKYLKVHVRNLDVSKLTTGLNNLVVDRLPVAINGADVYKAYHVNLPSNFTYSNITITIDFADMSVRNISNLKFYKCSSFNVNANTCNGEWTVLTPKSISSASKTATLDITGFSVYALAEPKQGGTTTSSTTSTTSSTTTTTPTTSSTTSTTTQSSSGSGGGYSQPSSSTTTVTSTVIIEKEEPPVETNNTSNTTNTSSTTNQTSTSKPGIQMTTGFAPFVETPLIWAIPVMLVGGIFAWKLGLWEYMSSHGIRVTSKKKFRYYKGKHGETRLVLS